MDFEWDEDKSQANAAKHGVDFQRASLVFDDPLRLERLDTRRDYGEDRFQTIGWSGDSLLFVVYTERQGNIRIISARPAARKERTVYEESFRPEKRQGKGD